MSNALPLVILISSLAISLFAYIVIAWKDRSWITWLTPSFVLSMGSHYVFPLIYLLLSGIGNESLYAFAYCYATFAATALATAAAYILMKPIRFRAKQHASPARNARSVAWGMLLAAYILYLPVLLEFRAYLADPRRIYELTRTGYGLYFYTSTFLAILGTVAYFFVTDRHALESALYAFAVGALVFWHGSKGEIIGFAFAWMLYLVYIQRKKIRVVSSLALGLLAGSLLITLFALFSSTSGLIGTFVDLADYADTVRNAMIVIDDPHATFHYGRLLLENEGYNRIPRAFMSNKPTDFGTFYLAKRYFPAAYRNNEGAPAFDIGATYADFGPFTLPLLSLAAALMAWLARSLTAELRERLRPGVFVVLLFVSGVSIIPIGGVFLLPETIVIAWLFSFALRFQLLRSDSVPLRKLTSAR